jgi:hypothetical protein
LYFFSLARRALSLWRVTGWLAPLSGQYGEVLLTCLERSHFLACCAFEIHSEPQYGNHYPHHASGDILGDLGALLASKLLDLDVAFGKHPTTKQLGALSY